MAELEEANRYDVVKLLKLMDAGDTMLQAINISLTAIIPQLKAKAPDFPLEEYVERLQQKVDIDSMLYQMVPIYNRYTHEEIARLIAFYETPLGRKMTKKIPQIMQETIAANQAWIEAIAKNMADSSPLKAELKMYDNEINKLFDVMGINFSEIASQMLEAWIKGIQEQNPNFSESDITSFRDMISKKMDIEILRNLWATVYNHHYNREEIAGIIVFHESPLGRKSIQVESQISQEQNIIQAYLESLSNETLEELMAENS